MKISKKIQADLQNPGASSVVYAVQNDSNTREVEIHLFSGGVSWTVPEDAISAVAFKKQDGKSGLYDKLPNGEPAVSVSESVVTIVLAQEVLTVQGIVSVSVVFYDENLNQIATFPFSVAVAENPSQGESLSNNYYNFQTIGDINAALALLNKSSVRIDVIQEFSEEGKQTARNNIGAIGDGDYVTELNAEWLGVGWNFPDDPAHPDNHRGVYMRYSGYRPDGTDMVQLLRMKGEGSVALCGIAPGIEDTDAVNKGQLDKAELAMVDKLCPSFTETGALVTCQPVEGYPLTVTAEEGTTITRCGKNLFNDKTWCESNGFTPQQDGSWLGHGVNKPCFTNTMGRSGAMYLTAIAKTDVNTAPFYLVAYYTDGTMSSSLAFYAADTFATKTLKTDPAKTVDYIKWTYGGGGDYYLKGVMISFADSEYEPYREGDTFPVGQKIPALPGVNTLWADSGEITVTGKVSPAAEIEKLKNAILSLGGNL